ncbi:MAG: hypothetical protein R3185_06560, partial [Candidatus Thermoplasmatota archaeon]|nr:hypothetical protein [Candidatus Thermoplasmatota archaeon]
MNAAPPALIVLLLTTLVLTPVSAQAPETGGNPGVQVRANLEIPVDIEALTPHTAPEPGGAFVDDPATRECDASYLTRHPREDRFTFEEPVEDAGCLEVRANFSVPQDAQRVVVSFIADRFIEQPGAAGPAAGLKGVDMEQEVRIYDETGAALTQVAYYQSDDHNRLERTFAIAAELAPSNREVTVGWWFRDVGESGTTETLPATGYGERFIANVISPEVRFEAIPLATPVTNVVSEEVQGRHVVKSHRFQLSLPQDLNRDP